MAQDHYGALLVRLCFAGPMLYAGLLMALDPAEFLVLFDNLVRAVRRFERHLQGQSWPTAFDDSSSTEFSARGRTAVRVTGWTVALMALVYFVGAPLA